MKRVFVISFIILVGVVTYSFGSESQIDNREVLSPYHPIFGKHAVEFRANLYHTGAYAYLTQYRYRWFEFLSTDIYVRSFPYALPEIGGGITLRLPYLQVFFIQTTFGKPLDNAYPANGTLPTGTGYRFSPDYSYSLRGGMYLPFADTAKSHFFMTIATGVTWYVDVHNRYIHYMSATPPPMNGDYEYEVRTRHEIRGFGGLEIGIGIHF